MRYGYVGRWIADLMGARSCDVHHLLESALSGSKPRAVKAAQVRMAQMPRTRYLILSLYCPRYQVPEAGKRMVGWVTLPQGILSLAVHFDTGHRG